MQLKNNLDKFIKTSSLGQDELTFNYVIKESGYYLVTEEGTSIQVSTGLNVIILDLGLTRGAYVKIAEGSKVNYLAINQTKRMEVYRHFHVYGELEYTSISLDECSEDLTITLIQKKSKATANTIALANGFKSCFVQRVFHTHLETVSNVYNVGVALNNANISFETTGKIEKGMSKSNCRQLSRGIIVDDNSKITSKPILLIDEYDCFANHGAAIGKISDEDLFYLMSRGLSKNDAFLLILKGIVAPFLDKVNEVFESEEVKEEINKEISKLIESD